MISSLTFLSQSNISSKQHQKVRFLPFSFFVFFSIHFFCWTLEALSNDALKELYTIVIAWVEFCPLERLKAEMEGLSLYCIFSSLHFLFVFQMIPFKSSRLIEKSIPIVVEGVSRVCGFIVLMHMTRRPPTDFPKSKELITKSFCYQTFLQGKNKTARIPAANQGVYFKFAETTEQVKVSETVEMFEWFIKQMEQQPDRFEWWYNLFLDCVGRILFVKLYSLDAVECMIETKRTMKHPIFINILHQFLSFFLFLNFVSLSLPLFLFLFLIFCFLLFYFFLSSFLFFLFFLPFFSLFCLFFSFFFFLTLQTQLCHHQIRLDLLEDVRLL